MSENNLENLDIEQLPKSDKTMTFSLGKIKKPSKMKAVKIEEEEDLYEIEDISDEQLLQNQEVPTEFEDVFSDEELDEDTGTVEGVVTVEEVFKQQKGKINENFHNETEFIPSAKEELGAGKKKHKAAIIAAIICGAVILSAIAVAIIFLL